MKFLDRPGDDEYTAADFAAGMGRRFVEQGTEIGRRVVGDLVDTAKLAQRATIPGALLEAYRRFGPQPEERPVEMTELPWYQSASSDPGVLVGAAAIGALGPGKGKSARQVMDEVVLGKRNLGFVDPTLAAGMAAGGGAGYTYFMDRQ